MENTNMAHIVYCACIYLDGARVPCRVPFFFSFGPLEALRVRIFFSWIGDVIGVLVGLPSGVWNSLWVPAERSRSPEYSPNHNSKVAAFLFFFFDYLDGPFPSDEKRTRTGLGSYHIK